MSSVAFRRDSLVPGIGMLGMMAPAAGDDSPAGCSGGGKAPYRHIDDLVLIGVDVDPHTPLRKMLELGDTHMRQATTYKDFRRPDLALQEYIKAFTIAVDKIPRHKDYPSMKSDRGDLNRLYNALKVKITTSSATFERIKEDIKQDNYRSGVQPAVPAKSPSGNSALSWPDTSFGTLGVGGNTAVVHKSKPAVQPKPQALHGKAIKQAPKVPSEDLADRFARLRDSQKLVTSIKTTGQSQPARPEASRPLQQPFTLVDRSMPAMPKLPDAIYSPARGTVTNEIANLPSSTRGMFSRTNSITSTPSCSAQVLTENAIKPMNGEQFITAHTYKASQSPRAPAEVQVPDGDIITADALERLINAGSQVEILLIDVRSREAFDVGHIKSTRTVCVEPEILMRENISADEIVDSMVLAPSNERLAIEQRDRVDLVVIYDESSSSMPTRITGDHWEMVLYNIRQALSYYSYTRPLRDSPKLLRGGMNAWMDKFGERYVETSDTISNTLPPSTLSTQREADRARHRAKTRTLSQNEINQFEDIIKQDQTGLSNFDYVTTRDDFIRRYPSITGTPESMTSVIGPQEEDFLAAIAPTPPRRPAPAIPRTRYSGLDSRDDSTAGATALQAANTSGKIVVTQNWPGLSNAGNTCYLNTTLQALYVSPGFVSELMSPGFLELWRGTTLREPAHPQLLTKLLHNLFTWMRNRQIDSLRPTTLMAYLLSIHEGYRTLIGDHDMLIKFGDTHQHDVDDLTTFFFNQLAAELNQNHIYGLAQMPSIPPNASLGTRALIERYWGYFMDTSGINFVDRHFAGLTTTVRQCPSCQFVSYQGDQFRVLQVTPERVARRGVRPQLLASFRGDTFAQNGKLEIKCSKCSHNVYHQVYNRIGSYPRLLRVYIRRIAGYRTESDYIANKTTTPLEFPIELDMGEFAHDEKERQEAANILGPPYSDGFVVPTEYELYSIQIHYGPSTNQGHYWSYLRPGKDRETWVEAEDDRTRLHRRASWRRLLPSLWDCVGERTPVQLLYKRKDIPWEEIPYGIPGRTLKR